MRMFVEVIRALFRACVITLLFAAIFSLMGCTICPCNSQVDKTIDAEIVAPSDLEND